MDKEKITVTINGVEYEYNVTNPLKENDFLEEIDGKWYVVHYPEGTENWGNFPNNRYKD